MEMLDRRDVPSTVLVDHVSYNLSGLGREDAATVTVTLIRGDDGYDHWDYLLHNNSYVYGQDDYWGIGDFRVPVGDADVTDVGSSNNAQWGFTGDPSARTVYWLFGDERNPGLKPGQEAHFTFTTPEVPFGMNGVQGFDPSHAGDVEGEALSPVPPVTQAQYQAMIARLNVAIQEQNTWEGSLLNILRAMKDLGDLRADKDMQLTAELAKPPAQQNAQLQADIASIDQQRAAYGQEFDADRVKYDTAHAQAVSYWAAAESMADALIARGITPSPATIPEVPDTKTTGELTTIVYGN
jgi:hypothetical protein